MTDSLITKYNRPTPRYTSYPPANHFTTDFADSHYRKRIEASNHEGTRNLSFYIHIPYCPQLCHYCGCNAYAMTDKADVEAYVEAVMQEIDLVTAALDKTRPVTQIHFGGGTPTAIPHRHLTRIVRKLTTDFTLTPDAEVAIECHPGYLTETGWEGLVQAGFNRMSIGVQDFHDDVLRLVNRKPPRLPLHEIFAYLKSQNIALNLDLIYGLPRQTPDRMKDNILRALALRPDRLVTFAYAHVPWVKQQQSILEAYGLPSSADKAAMFATIRQLLTADGYKPIGLDHFVLPTDSLYSALQNGLLHRNFQGYCTRATTGQVFAFGVTAISQLSAAYAQNTRDIEEYIRLVSNRQLPVVRGYALSREEQIAGEVIASVMCNGGVQWHKLAHHLALTTDKLSSLLNPDTALLKAMSDDGLIDLSPDSLFITPKGQPYTRIVASAFDPLLRNSPGTPTFSLAL